MCSQRVGNKVCCAISHNVVLLPSSDVGVFASPLNASGIVLAAPSQHHLSSASLAASWPIADQSSLSPPWASKGQETVAQDVGERQRHAQIFGGGERQPDVLLAEGRSDAGRLEYSIGDQPAIGVNGGDKMCRIAA
jgi:hypothetical protein